MNEYRVVWEIDISAETPQLAALDAQDIQRDLAARSSFSVEDTITKDTFIVEISENYAVTVEQTSPEKLLEGLRSRQAVLTDRLQEIYEAMFRYSRAGKNIPYEWVEELRELNILCSKEQAIFSETL